MKIIKIGSLSFKIISLLLKNHRLTKAMFISKIKLALIIRVLKNSFD